MPLRKLVAVALLAIPAAARADAAEALEPWTSTTAPAPGTALAAVAADEAPGQTRPEQRACYAAGLSRPVGASLRASHDAAVGGRVLGDRADAQAALTVDLGASLLFDVGACPRGQELALDVSATPRWTGPDRGASLDAAATLRFDPALQTDPHAGVLAWIPTAWELGYQGSLRAEPGLADRKDLSRDLFDRFTLTGATRAFRIAIADLCEPGDQRQECVEGRGPTHPSPVTFDLIAVDGATGFTEQGTRRDEQRGSLALLHVTMSEVDHLPVDAVVDLLKVERERVDVGGAVGTIDTVWPLYIATTNPATGTRYVIGWGEVADFNLVGPDGRDEMDRDHRPLEDRSVGGFGLSSGGALRGTGAGWTRSAYVTMAAEPMLEDKLVAEAWAPLDGVAVRARAFASRLERLIPADGQPAITWTGGVELGGSKRVAGLDVDVSFEAGRSYYGSLDGAPASPGFGARTQLTIHHAGDAAWSH